MRDSAPDKLAPLHGCQPLIRVNSLSRVIGDTTCSPVPFLTDKLTTLLRFGGKVFPEFVLRNNMIFKYLSLSLSLKYFKAHIACRLLHIACRF